MEIYVEYYKDVTPLETPQPEPLSEQTIPLATPRTKRSTPDQTMEGTSSGRRDLEARETISDETCPKQGQTEEKHPPTPSHTRTTSTTMMRSTALTVTQPIPSLRFPLRITKGLSEAIGTTSQGRLFTLSSMVRPTPTTATRTVAITREDSRLDALATVRQMVGPTSTTTTINTSTTTTASQGMRSSMSNRETQFTAETRLISPPPVSRITATTAPVGMVAPISQDLIWPGHPDIQGTSLFPQDNDLSTVAAGGLDPEERWKIHCPYDIPGVRRPTMETPDNLQRLAECEALVKSLQTMEYLTEFPTLERWDYRRFPPRYGDPHYHPSRLKKNGESEPRREGEERPPTSRPPGRDNRRTGIGHGGSMSPIRRVAEAARGTPEAQYTDNMEAPRDSHKMVDTRHIDEERNSTPRQIPQTERNIPTTSEQHSNQWEDDNREPEVIVEHVPLLNGGPSNSWSERETSSEAARIITTTPVVTMRTTPIEAVSISSTPQVSSTGMEERIPTTRPICLPEEGPQISCPVCDIVDCTIHNPRH